MNGYLILALTTPLVVVAFGWLASSVTTGAMEQAASVKLASASGSSTSRSQASSARPAGSPRAVRPDKKSGLTKAGMSAEAKEREEREILGRLDRLAWNRFHTRLCLALGSTWTLFGLMTALVSSLDPAIRPVLLLPGDPIDPTVLTYLLGAAFGALLFGWATDRFGRSRLIMLTVLVYLLGTVIAAITWNFWSFMSFRFVTGAGIGGAYVAVNSILQELIPARSRGTAIISINGTFWAGAMLSALASLVVLNGTVINPEPGWRVVFVTAGMLLFVVMPLLHWIPESPRWLIARNYAGGLDEAKRIVTRIEAEARREHGDRLSPEPDKVTYISPPGYTTIVGTGREMLFGAHRNRMVLGLMLMASQAFLYNGIFFDYARDLENLYGVLPSNVSQHELSIAFSNLAGALALGWLFDRVGRKLMIIITYVLSGVLLAITGLLFWLGILVDDPWAHTACWMAIFFVASAAASAAYLTVGEAFPPKMRATSIALLFAFGTLIGGVVVPLPLNSLVPARALDILYYFLAAALMIAAAGTEYRVGFEAAGKAV